MTKEAFLTSRWNNLLSLMLGFPALIYVVFVLSTSVLSARAEFIGLVIAGVVYWIVVEGHTNMRFAWQKKNSTKGNVVKQGFAHPVNLIMIGYNVVWWIPILLPFFGVIDYQTGFIAFFVVTIIRLAANLMRNNLLKPEQAVSFPLRSP